jgi:soluble cytochrome b562
VFAVAALATPVFAEEDTPLGKEMDKVNKAVKAVNRALADAAQKDANLAKLADAKAAMEKALTLEPAMAKDVPAADKEKFMTDYKASMQESLKTLEELRAAIADGKADDAAKAMEKLTKGKKDAHKKFKKED